MALSDGCPSLAYPVFGFGNSFCFPERGTYTFQACCAEGVASRGCFDGATYTYEACCYTAPVHWEVVGQEAWAKLSLPVGTPRLSDDAATHFGTPPCARGAPELGRYRNRSRCLERGGRAHRARVHWWDRAMRTSSFHFCAPRACSLEEVAASLVPVSFARAVSSSGRGMVVQTVEARQLEEAASSSPPRHRVGVMGSENPPAGSHALAMYQGAFRVCGRCELRRYGSPGDGGYLMCALDGPAQDYLAVYSYGIDAEDAWGEEVSRATAAVLHQYDCYVGGQHEPCAPPCRSVFHDECIAARASNETMAWGRGAGRPGRLKRFGTLASHLADNGHAHAAEGQLLLKADVEGAEWAVFCQASPQLLRKFRQLIVEFHLPFRDELVDQQRLSVRSAALQNLLEVFVIVHVHVNNACFQPLGSCLEVTFANRAFVEVGACSAPSLHELDVPNDARFPDPDMAELFPWHEEVLGALAGGNEQYWWRSLKQDR